MVSSSHEAMRRIFQEDPGAFARRVVITVTTAGALFADTTA
ncbi:hypothetical protein [Streptomyces sp. NPDC050704]